jgi:hypothetical protein
MKFFRWFLGLVCVGIALFETLPPVQIAGYKMGYFPATTPDEVRMIPLMDATPYWMLIAWAVVIVLFLVCAWRLFRGQRAFGVYAAAFVINAIFWWFMSQRPVYQQVFTPDELRFDYYVFAVMAVIGAAIFLAERRGRAPTT